MTVPEGNLYSVKGLFRWFDKISRNTFLMEERILLFYAIDFDEAISKAKIESVSYCLEDKMANFSIEAAGWWNAYQLSEAVPADGIEVYSRLMDTSLSTASFLRRYYPKSHDHECE